VSQALRSVLVVAGLDPSGGAGLLADVRTVAAHGLHPAGVASALTVQDSGRCHGFERVSPDVLLRQLEVLVDDLDVAAIKVGMVGSRENALAVAEALAPLFARGVPLVLDPVLRASVGADLIEGDPAEALAPLFSHATLLTPNRDEAEALTGLLVDSAHGQRRAARALRALGPAAVLVKGGHLEGELVKDLLDDGGEPRELSGPRLPGPAPHGTGCALSSEIAALLGLGRGLGEAVAEARERVGRRIAASLTVGKGGRGRPVLAGAGLQGRERG
jgi:hydroxymethylpyrimidine/phosphomethylpyrimidine kinase